MTRSRLWGCAIGVLVVLVGLLALGYLMEGPKWTARRASGGNDIAGPWVACVEYATKHDGLLPPLDKDPGRLMFDRTIMHDEFGVTGKSVTMQYDENAPVSWQEYAKDARLAENKELIDDHSWWYLGYEVSNEHEALAFVKAYLEQVVTHNFFNPDLNTGKDQPKRLHLPPSRLNEVRSSGGTKDAALATMPVFVERPGHYKGYSGGWVTYLDGHREYIDYPGRFPMTTRFIDMLRLLDDLGPVFVGS